MGWYVLRCKIGQEEEIRHSLESRLTREALKATFCFRGERLWRVKGVWRPMVKDLFPGYVFMESGKPEALFTELRQYREIVRILEEPGYLVSVYEEEEQYLRRLCGEEHMLKLSYGYLDRNSGHSRITRGPLAGMERCVRKFDWHKRFAQVEVALDKKTALVWAGLEVDEGDAAS